MATYIGIVRYRFAPSDSAESRAETQKLLDEFAAWSPPNGLTMSSLYSSLDNRMSIAVWETDDPTMLYVVTAKFAPWADNEIIPVIPTTDGLAAMFAAGLFTAPA